MSEPRSSFGRRAFLGSGVALSAGAVAAGTLADGTAAPAGASLQATTALGEIAPAAVSHRPLRAGSLTVNGLSAPVGIDPDDCQFAWTLRSDVRGARQSAYRIVVRRTDAGHEGPIWDSGTVETAQQAFVLYGGTALQGDASYEWTVQPRGVAGQWGPVATPATFTTSLRMPDWKAQWLKPAAASAQPDRMTYVRTEVTPPSGTLQRATVYASAAHTYRLYVNGQAVDAWPSNTPGRWT
jgi:alpha-L-rhamnosidase